MRLLVIFFTAVFLVSGCKFIQAKGEVGGVEVEAKTTDGHHHGDGDHHHNGHFCPPGQAKKNNC